MPTAPGSSFSGSMKFENPQIPEGINVGDAHPLKDFALLAVGALGAIAVIVALLAWSAEYVARFIPFGVEQALSRKVLGSGFAEASTSSQAEVVQRYLEELTRRLVVAAALPDGMDVTVHFVDEETVNAFATLGGHVVIFRGLLERMPSENALAMVLAHEIAHIKHRDPIVALGRGVTISVALASLAGLADSGFMARVINHAGMLTALKFSRSQETAADDLALEALVATYGHVHGAETLFEILQDSGGFEPPAFFSTHPVTAERIAKIKNLARESSAPQLVPLPSFDDPR